MSAFVMYGTPCEDIPKELCKFYRTISTQQPNTKILGAITVVV